MNEIFHNLDFYAPWPHFGSSFQKQLHEIRANMESLAPLVRALYVDADPSDLKGGSLTGLEFGEEDFHNKFRLYWDKRVDELYFQCNVGTEADPVWETGFYVNCGEDNVVFNHDVVFTGDVSVLGTFYTPGGAAGGGGLSNIFVEDTNVTSIETDTIKFNRGDFYISTDTLGNPIINKTAGLAGSGTITGASNLGAGTGLFAGTSGATLEFKSLTAGTGISIGSSATEVSITATGGTITVAQTDDNPSYSSISTLKFLRDDFYVSQNTAGTAIVNLRGSSQAQTSQITFSQTGDAPLNILSEQFIVNRGDFYISTSTTGKPILNLASPPTTGSGDPNIVSGVQIQQFSSDVEWIFNHNLGTTPLLWATYDSGLSAFIPEKVDVSNLNIAYFYFSTAVAGTAIVSSGRVSSRINFSTTNNAETQYSADRLKFDRSDFYISSDSTGDPILSLSKASVIDEKSITIPYPGRYERFSWWRSGRDITIQELAAVLFTSDGGFYPGIEYTVRYDDNPFNPGTELITGGSRIRNFYPNGSSILVQNSFNNPNIDAGKWVWLETGDLGEGLGMEQELHVTVRFVNR